MGYPDVRCKWNGADLEPWTTLAANRGISYRATEELLAVVTPDGDTLTLQPGDVLTHDPDAGWAVAPRGDLGVGS